MRLGETLNHKVTIKCCNLFLKYSILTNNIELDVHTFFVIN